MKRIGIVAAFILCFGAALTMGSRASAEMPKADPAALWNYITKVSPYQKWKMWPDHQGVQPGRAPHGPFHKVYVNDLGLSATKPPLPYGSIQVKESYNLDKKLSAITVMYKVKGYNPGDGDWFWAKYSPDGQAKPFGKPKGCIACHGTRARNDFVLVHEFK